MTLIAEQRYRVVELLPNNRRRTIDTDLSLMTARSSIALFRQIDPNREVVVETAEPVESDWAESDEAYSAHAANHWCECRPD